MALHLHRSNRTEALLEALARLVESPLDDPFAAECIVVQGKGMERWLSMQLARRLGIWANPSFPFPRRLIGAVMGAVLGEPEDTGSAYEPDAMTWGIAGRLPGLLARTAFAPLRGYLDDDENGRKRFQLAERIASVFDQYVVYRPEMILSWERPGDDWQSILWSDLVAEHGATHFAAR